jgi:hypothetical protein
MGEVIKLVWDEGEEPPSDQRDEIEEKVRENIRAELLEGGLGRPSELIFHHVFLGENETDPLVFIYGKRRSRAFHCCYDARPEWLPMANRGSDA